MKEETPHISLSIAMQELFRKANKLVYCSYGIQIFLFFMNMVLIFLHLEDSNVFIWFLFSFPLATIIATLCIMHRSRKLYELGECARKMDMIVRIFPNVSYKIRRSYLLSELPPEVFAKARENPDVLTSYESRKLDKYGILIENVQQNSFFTSQIMYSYSRMILGVILVIIFLISLSIIGVLFILSESSADNLLTQNVSRCLALLINLIFALNIIDHYLLFNKKSKELKRIDEDLEKIKDNPQEDDIITSFTEYNCILYDSLPCPDFVYNIVKDKLNTIWNNRINNGSN
ncbi:MAG: hypothetical protein N4A37_04055 [Prolixibacteraceae bacterium]|jgi:hypothetical protein|nr:hypothetical protein [Prolixibacteraceae bacterium]